MEIKGWVRNSLIDYPEHIATVLFTGGCNFRCPMCHNADLVLHHKAIENIPEHELFAFLRKRTGLIDGVVVSGGEPTIQSDLIPFLKKIKDLGFDIKLDTNGTRPDMIAEALNLNLVDYVALDIKAPPAKYPVLSGLSHFDLNIVIRSLRVISEKSIPFELRTTVVPRLLNIEDISDIASWLSGKLPEKLDLVWYVLQQYRGLHTLDPELSSYTPYTKKHLEEMVDIARQWIPNVKVRGV